MAIVTAEICNYNGNREYFSGKGRLVRLLDSIPSSLSKDERIFWLTVDCGSHDGSREILKSFGAHNHRDEHRLKFDTSWKSTTRTNADLLRKNLQKVNTEFFWRIENDSIFLDTEFVRSGKFIWCAVELLNKFPDIDIVHLRRWTPVDRADLPGSAFNYSRVEKRVRLGEVDAYILEKQNTNYIWADITNDVPRQFFPSNTTGYGHMPDTSIFGKVRGAVRFQDKKIQRLILESYATYCNHGWIGRTEKISNVLETSNARTEDEMVEALREEITAARLYQDAFISAGWRTRIITSEAIIKYALNWATNRAWGTVIDRGGAEKVDQVNVLNDAIRATFK